MMKSILWAALFLSTTTFAVTTPTVTSLTQVAADANIGGQPYIGNAWGLHQPRITVSNDGTVRILYLTADAKTTLTWKLMKKVNGKWELEKSEKTTDDTVLLRNPTNDHVYVVGWNKSVPTIYNTTLNTQTIIPGQWQVFTQNSRHYGNTGIGVDGTTCIKASREFTTNPPTLMTNTEYICGKYYNGYWTWNDFISNPIGARHAYDYIFPNPNLGTIGLFATSTSDLHKLGAGLPNLKLELGNYIFNGFKYYTTQLNTDESWSSTEFKFSNPANPSPTYLPSLRPQDSFIDSRNRVFTVYHSNDTVNTTQAGLYMVVNDLNGKIINRGKLDIPTYGYGRIIEDAKHRLWLFWNAQGSTYTHLRAYPITEVDNKFVLGAYTDLSAALKPHSIQGNLFLAVPRGGNTKSNVVNAIFNTCANPYVANVNISSTCYPDAISPKQKVFHLEITLPD